MARWRWLWWVWLAVLVVGCGSTGAHSSSASSTVSAVASTLTVPPAASPTTTAARRTQPAKRPRGGRRHIGVRVVVLHLVDPTRTMVVGGRRVPRAFDTIVRYPTGLNGRFPLIVFGHGFAVSPTPYAPLLDAWTRAGYVVAAPVFPLENAAAPGGPDERDLPNQPGDMSLVISSLESPGSPAAAKVARLIDLRHIAVTGQSDGGDTALAVTYDRRVRDSRISVAMILSGAQDPFVSAFAMPAHAPPLLAIQGTDDTINPPSMTSYFFDQAGRPKFLLQLIGAGHLPPYTEPGSELTEVEHMTLAFLNHYLKGHSPGFTRYLAAHSVGPGTVLTADP